MLAFLPVIVALDRHAVGGDRAKRQRARGLMLHFAYGANMHRAVMRRHAAAAEPVGAAALADHRFIITADGYASVAPALAQTVHGVLWRITPRDRVTLDAWENIAGELYRAEMLPVRHAGRPRPALVYIARPQARGPTEGRLYGARGRGGARLAIAERLYCLVAALAAAGPGAARARASSETFAWT